MALILQNQVDWMIYRIDSGGALAGYLCTIKFDDDERKAQEYVNQNKKAVCGVNKKTKVKVFRRPVN